MLRDKSVELSWCDKRISAPPPQGPESCIGWAGHIRESLPSRFYCLCNIYCCINSVDSWIEIFKILGMGKQVEKH